MAQNTGTTVTAPIRVNDDQDPIASAHQDEIKGGLHPFETLAKMHALILARRSWGMMGAVNEDPTSSNNKTYQLTRGHASTNIMDNANWKIFAGESSGGITTDFYWTATAGIAGTYTDFATLYAAMDSVYGMRRLIVCSTNLEIPVGTWNFDGVELTSKDGEYLNLNIAGTVNNPSHLSGGLLVYRVDSGAINVTGLCRVSGNFSLYQSDMIKVIGVANFQVFERGKINFDLTTQNSISVDLHDASTYFPGPSVAFSIVNVYKKSPTVIVGSKPGNFFGTLNEYTDPKAKNVAVEGISGADNVQEAIVNLVAATGKALYTHPPVADKVALKALNTTSTTNYPDRWIILAEDPGSIYRFDRESTVTDDNDTVIAPTTGSGRWLKTSGAGVVYATNTEETTGTEAAKASTPAGRTAWWTNIKSIAQTISGVWTLSTSFIHDYLTANGVVTLDANKKFVSSTAQTGFNLPLAASGESAAGKLVAANDARLSDARTPTAHTHTTATVVVDPSTVVADRTLTFNLKKILIGGTLSANVTFELASSGNVNGVPIRLHLVSNGTNVPAFSTAFKRAGGEWVSGLGVSNILEMQYIANSNYISLSIFQEI